MLWANCAIGVHQRPRFADNFHSPLQMTSPVGMAGKIATLGLVRKQPLRAIGLMKQLCNSIRHGNRRA